MFSPLVNIYIHYACAIIAGIAVAMILKSYYFNKLYSKIKGYQVDIVKSHEKILELKEANEKLEKRLEEAGSSFLNDKILMN